MARARPIIFSGPMVRALLDGRKTMTRRLATSPLRKCETGDRLWVRENFHVRPVASAMHAYSYFDEENPAIIGGWEKVRLLPYHHLIKRPEKPIWRPSIHMPRSISRLTLVVTGTKTEPLHNISETDARAEGAEKNPVDRRYRTGFVGIWRALHGDDSWHANPEVVALQFRVIKANIDAAEALAA